MLNPKSRALMLAALACCLMLPGCNDSAPESDAKPSTGDHPKSPRASALTEEMVAAVASEATAKVISVHFGLTRAPAISEGLPINIAVVPHQEFSSVAAHFFGQDGLTLISGDALGPISDTKPEKPIKHQIVLMPAREGVYMINATVETSGADGTVSRVFSIPIVVPPQANAPAASASAPAATPAPAPAANPAPTAPPAAGH